MRKRDCNLSHDRLQEVLHYDPETGEFRWKVSLAKSIKAGDVAGSISKHWGYYEIRIDRTLYKGHRLAWFYMTGVWPIMDIDHINGIRSDNRFCNLRGASRSENNQNSRSSRGSSVFRGVSWSACAKKWRADIRLNRKIHYLGLFDIEEDAAEAYQSAQRRLHPFAPG